MASIQAGKTKPKASCGLQIPLGTGPSKKSPVRVASRIAALLVMAVVGASTGGCTALQDAGDYLNFRNSFLDSSQVGRFDKANPCGEVKPVKWPILDQLDVIDEPSNRWANATDPTPADLVPEVKEYVLGPGDTVQVSVFELIQQGQEFLKQIRINELGYLNVQNVGSIQVLGLTPSQVEQKIAQILIDQHILPAQPAPQVSVSLLDSRARVFSVLGAAARPGTYNVLSGEFKLLDALALAGDIPVQPGMDYVYVIRQTAYTPATQPGTTPTPTANQTPTSMTPAAAPETPVAPSKNPLDVLEQIEHGDTQPGTVPSSTGTAPATSQSRAPQIIRPLPMAVVLSDSPTGGTLVAQARAADLEAALGAPAPATAPTTATAVTPVVATATGPATLAATAATDQGLLTQASGVGEAAPQYVFIDGKWVPIAGPKASTTGTAMTVPATSPLALTLPSSTTTSTTLAPATGLAVGTLPGIAPTVPSPLATATATGPATTEPLKQQRVIRIPISSLREGVSKYNIVIRPGDILNIPPVEPGEFYLMGNIGRPGVYSLTGRKITLKMAVAAGGNLGSLAVPRRCELIRRIGADQEAIIQVNLQAIFDGEQPDIFLKSNDVLNVGSDVVTPFLAVMRNAYRASYGWGFVYDRNFGPQNSG